MIPLGSARDQAREISVFLFHRAVGSFGQESGAEERGGRRRTRCLAAARSAGQMGEALLRLLRKHPLSSQRRGGLGLVFWGWKLISWAIQKLALPPLESHGLILGYPEGGRGWLTPPKGGEAGAVTMWVPPHVFGSTRDAVSLSRLR